MLELDSVEIILQGESKPLKAVYRAESKHRPEEETQDDPMKMPTLEILQALCTMSAVQLLDPDTGGYKYYLILNRVMVELPPGNLFKIQIIVKATKSWKSST